MSTCDPLNHLHVIACMTSLSQYSPEETISNCSLNLHRYCFLASTSMFLYWFYEKNKSHNKMKTKQLYLHISFMFQVEGMLQLKSVYSSPLEPTCSTCGQVIFLVRFPINGQCCCNKCGEDTSFNYNHSLCCTLKNKT